MVLTMEKVYINSKTKLEFAKYITYNYIYIISPLQYDHKFVDDTVLECQVICKGRECHVESCIP